MHSTNLSSGLSSSNRKNYKSNSHFNNKSNGNGQLNDHNNYSSNSTNSSNGSINLGAQLISSQLKGNSNPMLDQISKDSDVLSKKKQSSTSGGLSPGNHSSSAAIYLQKPHHQLPASTSYFHNNSPSSNTAGYNSIVTNGGQQVSPSSTTYKQHRSRYSSPLLKQSILDDHTNNLNKITPYITSPTRNNYSSNSNLTPNRSSSTKFYSNLGNLNGSTTNSSGSPNSSASASPNVTSISYPNNTNQGSANNNSSANSNGNLKKASSLRHTNIRSPIHVSATTPNVKSQQHSPTNSAFQSTSLNNKPNNNFNSNYLIKKKVLSSSPVANLNSVSFINNSNGLTTTTTNGLGSSNGLNGSNSSLSNTNGISPYQSISLTKQPSSASSTGSTRSNRSRSKTNHYNTTSLNNKKNGENSNGNIYKHRNTISSTADLKKTLQNIELKMRIIASPNIRIADLFKCFLKNVPKSTETIESLVHYGDNIGAKVVKCLINENLYETQSLINQDYDIYQGPALCVTYDSILKDEHWDEIFICQDEETNFPNGTKANGTSSPSASKTKSFIGSKFATSTKASTESNGTSSNGSQPNNHASKFISFFHISDFIAILSGYKVAFVDPYERFNNDERSYVAIFDLENDTYDIEQFEDQFKPLEKIFNVPLLKNRYYNGTIIRLPLRTQTSSCSVSNKLVHVKDILMNAKDFMKEAHLHILFAKNISNIQFCRTKDSQNIEKIYSINVEDSCMDQFRSKYKKINDAILDGDFPRTSTVIITLRKQIETKIEKTEWILSIFADTMRLLNSNYFLMKLAIPISDNCEKDIRFSHKSNLISSDTGFIKTLFLTKPIICYIEDKEGILMSHFCRLNISDSLKLSHFNDAYALMLKDLTRINRKDSSLLWSLMPDLDKNTEFTELLGEIWQELAKHELFYSCTEGWGYVAIEDMIINDVENKSILQEILTKIYSESNYPVVIMPAHVLKALQKHSPKDSLQIMTPSQTSDILHNNIILTESLNKNQRIELLRYLIKDPSQSASSIANNQPEPTLFTTSALNSNWPTSAARYILDLPLLMLANHKFIRFQPPNKSKTVFICEKEYMSLFSLDTIQTAQFINPDLPNDLMQTLKKFEFQRLTQAQMISDSELSELISVPKEWRSGDERIVWPKSHDKFNIDWLENLWKYLSEYCKTDLTMMENFNIIYTLQSVNNTLNSKIKSTSNSLSKKDDATKNLILYKLSKNSNLVYTPSYNDSLDSTPQTIGAMLINSLETTSDSASSNNSTNNNSNATMNTIPNNSISEETYGLLIKILTKLGFQCIESISPTILNHPLFQNYVPNLRRSRFNLLRAFRNKYKHASLVKITQDFNALLNESDIKLLQSYLAKTEQVTSKANQSFSSTLNTTNLKQQTKESEEEQALIDLLKELPIFENSALECSDKYLPLKEATLIYDAQVRLPFELPGIKPFIVIQNSDTRQLVQEKLNVKVVKDFSVIIKEIIRYCTSKELNTLNTSKVHSLGKWLLLNCSSYFLESSNNKGSKMNTHTASDLVECIRTAKLFLNQNQELCAATQFINPSFKERYMPILDTKWMPARDLITDEKCLTVLKELKMRNCFQLKVDEITELYEFSLKQNDTYRRLFAELIVETLINRLKDSNTGNLDSTVSIEKILNEYSTTKAVTLRHFLMSVNWIPLQRERPQSYPQSLLWKGSETGTTSAHLNLNNLVTPQQNGLDRIRFSSPRDCVDSQFAYCSGSVSCVSDLEIPSELKTYVDLKQVHLDIVVRHLKLTTKCFESSAVKAEWYDYLTVTKKCYEFMSTCDSQDIFRELKANDLNEWIWNGAGFSSINSIYLITEKDHPLCSHVATLPYELYVFVKFFEKLGIKKLPDSKQLETILAKCAKNFQKVSGSPPNSPDSTNQVFLESAAKNFPLINWIKAYCSGDKKLQSIVKDYEENLSNSNLTNGSTSPFVGNSSTSSSSNNSSPNKSLPLSENKIHQNLMSSAAMAEAMTAENSNEFIFLYLPEIYKSVEIKENLINSVMTLVKNRQIKILDEEAYLMRKVAVAAAAAVASGAGQPNGQAVPATKNQIYNIFDHYRVYNEIILPNLNNLSKNVKDSVVLFALDHADPKMLEILRDHPCIPVSPFGRRLKKPNKLVHPTGKIAPLYSDSDERFPCGSEETYLREDRLQILKILGMKCDSLNWQELIERAESITKIREYEVAIERSIVILSILNEKLNNTSNSANSTPVASKLANGTIEQREERDAKANACEQIRDIAFIPVKPKPYHKLTIAWYGDKFKFRFAKPKELLSGMYEPLCSSLWPIPLYEYKKKERIITKQIEQFFGIDDISGKFTLKDALNQLDEVAKINLQEIDDSKEVKIVTDMCFQLYEYIQLECQKKPAELVPMVREFFAEKPCILLQEEFISVNQLCWHLNVNLKSMFYQIPTNFLRSLKYLFNQVLMVKVNLDLPDLLHVVDTMRKKYKDLPILSRDDFNMLMNVYGLMIDQGYQIITNLYLPNINQVLLPGRLLYFHPLNSEQIDKAEDYVHPAVDRRICIIAGCTMNKKLANQESLLAIQNSQNTATVSPNSLSNGRVFPRVFGNKRLEGILARLDDDKIDINLVNNIDEGNPQILLEYLLEANRIHSLSAFLSEDDIFVILKYFNDFLARNYQAATFQRLKELKIFKPVWSEKHINLNFPTVPIPTTPPPTTNGSSLLNLNLTVPNIYLISDEMAALMKRSFKLNPFKPTSNGLPASATSAGQTPTSNPNTPDQTNVTSPPHTILVRRSELSKLYTHLSLSSLNDLEAFINLCLPQFRKLDAKCQNNFLKYLYEEILEKSYMHEKEKCFKILREKLYIQTRKGDQQLISDLYDMKSDALKNILNDSYFPDENFDSPQCLRFLKEAGLRTYLPSDLCKKCMNEIENKVSNETCDGGWTDELRARSKWIYQHLVENWQRFDDSVLQQRFLEPYCPAERYVELKQPFEYAEFNRTCLKLSDAELQKYEALVWSSSFILPQFVQVDTIDANGIEFLKLNRKPCFAIVNQHLNNICESVGSKKPDFDTNEKIASHDETVIGILGKIYTYLDDLHINEHHRDMYKQLEDKEIVWSATTRKFVSPNKVCIELEINDEIPPFLYSLTPSLKSFKSLLMRLGAKEKPYPMLYGDILRKMAKVCGDDYLNSNELCKALKAMECFFKYLKNSNSNNKTDQSSMNGSNSENVSSQFKLPGLYFVTTELKLEKSSAVVILDNRDNLDDTVKLPQDKFVFNPSEKVFKMNTNEIKPLIDKIFISQRPTLFSQKYEATYDYTLPDDPDSQRQNLLTSLERKYQQIFTSRQLHRCLARCISNEEARRSSPKHLPIDEVEKVIRERLSSIKVTCVEYLETSLSYRKLSQQQKLEQTVDEKAVYLTHESLQFATLYVSKKHIEQPYFALCLARALQPLLIDLHFDHSIFTSLIATSVSQMSRLLQLVNVATEENILSVIKLQYVPSSGKLYGDDINLLAQYDTKLHNVLIGDLCVFANVDGSYIYCQISKITAINLGDDPTSKYMKRNLNSTKESSNVEFEFTVQVDDNGIQTCVIGQKDLYVLENWHRIYDAMNAKPPDERETFKYQENSSSSAKNHNTNGEEHKTNGKREENDQSSNASDSSDKSDTSSTYGSDDNIPNSIELEQAKAELNNELRLLWGLEENDRKKKINRLLLKWHPDKNTGKEKFASEVFKHLKKQIELYKTDPFLAGFYRSTYSSYGGFGTGTGTGTGTSGYGSSDYKSDYKPGGYGHDDYKSRYGSDDYKSRHYGSFDDLHGRKGSPNGGSPHSSPNRESTRGSPGTGFGDYDTKGPGPSNLGRTGSFRQEWERRRQQKRQTGTGTDPRDRSSPSSARRRGTDFTQMDASLWFTQAKSDLDSANNDMHPITGKPAYEWVCYKCYRAVEKALRAYHYFKGNGKLPASDIHGLLLGVETNIRDIAFRFCNFIGNEANSMQYPGIARFGKTPNEVFPLTKAEQALDYGKELIKLVDEVIYAN